MKYRFLSLLLGLFAFPLLSHAAAGDNCRSDLLKNFSPQGDWRTATVLEALDGSVWRRGIIASPHTSILLAEGETSTITATVPPGTDAQIFLFAPEESGNSLSPPATGTCFEAAPADATGTVSFTINSRILWQALGEELVADIFYRLEQPQEVAATNSQNSLQIGAFLGPQRFSVSIDPIKQNEFEQKGKVIIRDKNFANSNDMLLYKRGDLNGQDLTGVGWNDDGCQTFCDGNIQQGVFLDPKALPSPWHGDNFVGLADAALLIARAPGPHTFYTKSYDSPASVEQNVRQALTRKSLYMEALKRALLGNPHTGGEMPALTIIDDRQLRVVASGRGDYSERTIQLVKNIRYLMTDPTLRVPAARFLAESVQAADAFLTSELDPDWDMASALLQIFPQGASTAETWGEDLIRLFEFWTDSSLENVCLMLNNGLFGQNFRQADFELDYCGMEYVLGKTPTLLLKTDEAVDLTPQFVATELTYAERGFDHDESFAFAAGKKKPFYYRYRFTEPFDTFVDAKSCITAQQLPHYIERLTASLDLSAAESAILAQELHSAWDFSSETPVRVQIADPLALSKRIAWRSHSQPLDLLQLFFSLEPNACAAVTIELPAIAIQDDRAGSEIGIIR